ncbi:uncharacterized protein LOC134691566 [Mytilus trossulus]|uniref:uncharacterized protein LOC134691566 n=1 Tax=Mytilus trossulus TaxID=6551 RepID=UPI003006C0CF
MIRGKTISYSSFKKKERSREEEELESQLNNLNNNENINDKREEITHIELQLRSLRESRIKGAIMRAKAKCQYADDSTLILDDSEESLNSALDKIDLFYSCSGLKANFEKTQVIWIGAKRGCGEELNTNKTIIWNHSGNFKLLGIQYCLSKVDICVDNYLEKIQKVKNLLSDWSFRNITIYGKIVVVKTLALPILIQCFTVLPDPSPDILKQLQAMLYRFVWDGKGDKIKRNILISNYEDGGVKMPHIESFIKSLKLSWVKKVLDPTNYSSWKVLLADHLEMNGGENMWHLSKSALNEIKKEFNPFWQNVISSYASLCEPLTTAPSDILSQPLFLNENIMIDGKTAFYKRWIQNNVFFINDLIQENGEFYNYDGFIRNYNIKTTFLEFYGLILALPKEWKNIIHSQVFIKLNIVSHKIVTAIKTVDKVSKHLYKFFLEKIKETPSRIQEKWKIKLGIDIVAEEWNYFFSLPLLITEDPTLRAFQYRLLHRILGTNILLMKYEI